MSLTYNKKSLTYVLFLQHFDKDISQHARDLPLHQSLLHLVKLQTVLLVHLRDVGGEEGRQLSGCHDVCMPQWVHVRIN